MGKSFLLSIFLLATQLLCAQQPHKKDSAISLYKNAGTQQMAMEELQKVKAEIIRLLKQIKSDDWTAFHLIIEAPPFSNKGFNSSPSFLNKQGRSPTEWVHDQQLSKNVFDLIFRMNQNTMNNQIVFFTKRNDYANASIFISYNQNIEETFQNRLPVSMRGKTIPWYKKVK